MKNCKKFRITGRVQGVWFRESTRQQAERLGLTGHAFNCPDGTVEVLACGESDALGHLAEWLKHGPKLARVSSVSSSDYEGEFPSEFSTG